jgi:phosphoserine phosphatase
VTTTGNPDFVPPPQRIATFDNDGTLWSEKPFYFQLAFAVDRVKALAPQYPQWKTQQPFRAVIEADMKTLLAGGKKTVLELVMATHAGMSTEEFAEIVDEWIKTARHPRFDRPYTDLVYQPMLELMDFLRGNGFKVFIASAGGVEFMRVWSPRVYGVPPEQIIGSSIATKFEMRDGVPVLVRQPKIDFIDDKAEKAVGIHKFIGQRPLAAFGNSDGDLEMLQWTTAENGARFGLIVHHTDEQREWAYDRDSAVGRLDQALTQAAADGWTVVDMKRDWKVIYPFQLAVH